MDTVKEIAALTKKDKFLVCVSIVNGGKVETQCMTNDFPSSDIGVSKQAIIENIDSIAKKSAPVTPSSLT